MTALAAVIFFAHATGAISQTPPADVVIVNAIVRTMNDAQPLAAAIAVRGNKIAAVGTEREVRRSVGARTRVINAGGRLVLPGFNDAHVHFMAIGNSFSTLDLDSVSSVGEAAHRVAGFARFLPKGRWILGNAKGLTGSAEFAKALDAASPDNPVLIYTSADTAIANTTALRLAGLSSTVKKPDGILSGDALRKVKALVPGNHMKDWVRIAETATNYAASLGITSVQDVQTDDNIADYRELERAGKLKTRIYECRSLADWRKLSHTSDGPESMVRPGCLKSFYDGDPEWTANLANDVAAADKAGFQIAVHAIGREANNTLLGIFAAAADANGKRDRRFRIEHAHDPSAGDLAKFAQRNIVASVQPFLFYGGFPNTSQYRAFEDARVRMAFGSDAPMTDFDPLKTIHAAVVGPGEGDPGVLLTVAEAVRAHTLGSAYAEFQEKVKGSIEPGKLADLVVLSEDIFTIKTERFRDVRVTMTITNGIVVYESGATQIR